MPAVVDHSPAAAASAADLTSRPSARARIEADTADLLRAWRESPEPSLKLDNYFEIYAQLFGHLRGTACTFVEIGVLKGGSLYMWRDWLGPQARIIGIDMNPAARRWADHGFEIFIGDQGDPEFVRQTLAAIGQFDVLLDDGGHQSCQQIVTAIEAIRHARQRCLVVVEDTHTSFMSQFAQHGKHTFLEYAKDSTDVLQGHSQGTFPEEMPTTLNKQAMADFGRVHSVQFFCGLVAWQIAAAPQTTPLTVINRPLGETDDFRYNGRSSAEVDWPHPFETHRVQVKGGWVHPTLAQTLVSLPARVARRLWRIATFNRQG